MKNLLMVVAAAVGMSGACAVPTVSEVTVTVTDTANVKVTYALSDGPAVVTPEFWTRAGVSGEWVEQDPAGYTDLVGDVNREVANGERAFHWVTRNLDVVRQIEANTFKVVVKAWPLSDPPAYMAVDLAKGRDVRYYSSTNALPGGFWNRDYRTKKFLFRKIPAADVIWRMGKVGHSGDAWSPRYVKLTKNYYMGVFPVTQGQWANVYDHGADIGKTMSFTGVADARRPSLSTDSSDPDATPVNGIGWNDCRGGDWPGGTKSPNDGRFMGIIRAITGVAVDLPTNTQWEYACRAGTSGNYYNGGSSPGLIGWTAATADSAKSVGQKGANPWGLYDMVGNVCEWCLDWKNDTTQSQGGTQDNPEVDPEGPSASDESSYGGARIIRGGCWGWPSTYEFFESGVGYRCATQWNYSHYGTYGFRLCVACP